MIILLLICLAITGFFIYNLYNQVQQLEQYLLEATKVEDEFENYYQYFLTMFIKCHSELKDIDTRGSFSSDDEVGFAFRVIIKAIEDVKIKIEQMKIQDEQEQFEQLKQKYGKN
jgi:hypothetical protein